MRKTIVTALVALLVMLALVSCDSSINVPGEQPEYTEDGQRLVTVKINTGGTAASRSLNSAIAKESADYMEVIFRRGSAAPYKYYRAGGPLSRDLTVKIPVGSYPATDAIMLIGRAKDHTLLATGELTGAPVPVTTDSNTISFTVAALSVNTSTVTLTTPTPLPPSFAIDESSGGISSKPGFSESGAILPGITSAGEYLGVPCFQVPTDCTGILASLTFSGISAVTGAKIKVQSLAKVTPTPVWASGTSLTVTAPLAAATLGTSKIDLTITTGSTEGQYELDFDIPVRGFDETNTGHLLWHINGGTKSGVDIVGTDGQKNVYLIVMDNPQTFTEATIPGHSIP